MYYSCTKSPQFFSSILCFISASVFLVPLACEPLWSAVTQELWTTQVTHSVTWRKSGEDKVSLVNLYALRINFSSFWVPAVRRGCPTVLILVRPVAVIQNITKTHHRHHHHHQENHKKNPIKPKTQLFFKLLHWSVGIWGFIAKFLTLAKLCTVFFIP